LPLNEKIKFVAIEGIIKRDNSALAKALASFTHARLILEEESASPLIEVSSSDPKDLIFKKHLLRLMDRYKAQKQLTQTEIFYEQVISDYLFYADRVYANLKLEPDDLPLYESIVNFMEKDVAVPDLVIYLQSNSDTILDKMYHRHAIKNNQRGKNAMDENYIMALNEEFNQFFIYYRWSPVLIVNANQLNPENPQHAQDLFQKIQRNISGIIYYNPPVSL
jgi:deoxyguanosine kinase